MTDDHDHDEQVVGYLLLRKAIGILGLGFPFLLVFWCLFVCEDGSLRSSISAYYHTCSHDWFVGILFAIGIFLWSYRGPKGEDTHYATLAGVCAWCVALLPTSAPEGAPRQVPMLVAHLHTAFAVGLFLVLAYFSLKIFTRSEGERTPQKKQRDVIYRICGWAMLACIALIGVFWALQAKDLAPPWLVALKPVFVLETLALAAFGVSWLTKGEAICGDPAPQPNPAVRP